MVHKKNKTLDSSKQAKSLIKDVCTNMNFLRFLLPRTVSSLMLKYLYLYSRNVIVKELQVFAGKN